MRISDWSSDVCSSDLQPFADHALRFAAGMAVDQGRIDVGGIDHAPAAIDEAVENREAGLLVRRPAEHIAAGHQRRGFEIGGAEAAERGHRSISWLRSEEHTSELQSLMRISYAVF